MKKRPPICSRRAATRQGRWKREEGKELRLQRPPLLAPHFSIFLFPSSILCYMPSSFRSSVFTSPSATEKDVALVLSRSRTSGSFHSPWGMYSSRSEEHT